MDLFDGMGNEASTKDDERNEEVRDRHRRDTGYGWNVLNEIVLQAERTQMVVLSFH